MEGSWGRDIGAVTLRSLLKAERQVLKKNILRAIGSKQLVIWVTNLNKVKHIDKHIVRRTHATHACYQCITVKMLITTRVI